MSEVKIGDIVLVEQAWEDESGAYHDETATVLSIEPVLLEWNVESEEVLSFLDNQEFTLDQLQKIPEFPKYEA